MFEITIKGETKQDLYEFISGWLESVGPAATPNEPEVDPAKFEGDASTAAARVEPGVDTAKIEGDAARLAKQALRVKGLWGPRFLKEVAEARLEGRQLVLDNDLSKQWGLSGDHFTFPGPVAARLQRNMGREVLIRTKKNNWTMSESDAKVILGALATRERSLPS